MINPDAPTAANIAKSVYQFLSPQGQVMRTKICDRSILFTITNPDDAIQRSHARGTFYEPDELAIIGQWFKPGTVFCDIGANIGNHTIYALKILGAARSILFEPNPDAIEILRSNIYLNGLQELADMTSLGVGLSDVAASGMSIKVRKRNMGGGRIVAGGGDVQTVRGDDALAGKQVDFIKIDIEGMELRALAGLAETIARCRPTMFIEVDNVNSDAFFAWVSKNGYRVETSFQRYSTNVNYLILPNA
jgi:FkbM family methyltransferase